MASQTGSDSVIAFRTEISRIMGKVARLGPSVETILKAHAYPEPVSHTLGEALVLAAMLGASLRDGGKLILQTKTDGRLPFLVVHYDAPGRLRGYANFDKTDQALAAERGPGDQAALLGTGHLMMTLDQGDEKTRYQGIVELENQKLVDAAHTYFRRSEQLPTFIRLAVARAFIGGSWTWRAGGLMIQHLLAERGQVLKPGETGEERDATLEGDDDEDWNRVRFLASTVEDHEMLDPTLVARAALDPAVSRGRRACGNGRAHRGALPLLQRLHRDVLEEFRPRRTGGHARK